ncbi:MAG TPA: lytic murein transglycosylase [Paracoccaceae bacterium]|nr:lytic murein transglycosylase [Paracoccaceae bacterium]HMO72288.1 lytic murein transglycosylase [Paracoccaceae bacterium]
MATEPAGTSEGLAAWIAAYRPRALAAGVSPATFDAAMAGLTYDPDVVRRDRRQSEFTKTIWDYLDTAVSDDRVARGRAALARHADLLARIEARHGVEKEVVAAIWGLESAYGTFRGDVPTLRALATLAHDGRRAAFFEGELTAALRILDQGHTTPDRMRGSWAGAMGHTQFMPSSFLALAVDFDGDGRRDVWGDDPGDALASAAAYLAHHGWQRGMPWGMEVMLPPGFDFMHTGERVVRPVADWQSAGVRAVGGGDLPDHGPGSVLLPAGHRGAAFLIWPNFQVIERYNTADAYVIAIGHLSDRLRGAPPIAAAWPREDRALTLEERLELQTRLTAAGHDTKGVDGRIGPNTIAATRAFQAAQGLVPDGYANPALLERLRAETEFRGNSGAEP